jgi:NADH-quinone oxidoreductase subunit G
MPKLTIDGKVVEVPKGTTVIQAARQVAVEVPHYCWHPGLSVAGNCRICLVEVEGMPTLQIACNLLAADNMVVRTQSEKAKRGRADVMELLLINHPLDCPICDQAGECKLQEYSFRIGNDRSRFDFPKVHKPKHVKFSDKVMFDAERCILCTRCVRFCQEIAGQDELDIVNRGDRNEIAVKRGGELTNPYQMNVIDVCPVGALTSMDFRFKSRVWFLENTNTVCSSCSRGCNVVAGARWNRLLRLIPRENAAVNKWWMCDDGRLNIKHVEDDRLGAPMVRKNGALVEVGWDEAIEAAARGLEQAGDDLFALVSARLTNEEIFLAQKVLDKLGTPHRDVKPRAFAKDDLLRTGDGNPNSKGAALLAVTPGKGGVSLANLGASQNLAGAALIGEDLDDKPELLAVLAKMPFVLLPGLTSYEKDGSFTNVTGRVQRIAPCVRPPGEAWPDWKILGALRARIANVAKPKSAAEVFGELAAEHAAFSGMSHGRLGLTGLDIGTGGAAAAGASAVQAGAR